MPVPTAVPPSAKRYTPCRAASIRPKIVQQHPGISGPFLTQREWGGVLHVRTPNLDDVIPTLVLSRPIASRKPATAGTRRWVTLTAVAIYMADGNESLDDCAI